MDHTIQARTRLASSRYLSASIMPAGAPSAKTSRGWTWVTSHPSRRGVAADALCQPYRHDRDQRQGRGHHVDHRRLVGPEEVAEDPDRQGLHRRARGEGRDDDLVEAERE